MNTENTSFVRNELTIYGKTSPPLITLNMFSRKCDMNTLGKWRKLYRMSLISTFGLDSQWVNHRKFLFSNGICIFLKRILILGIEITSFVSICFWWNDLLASKSTCEQITWHILSLRTYFENCAPRKFQMEVICKCIAGHIIAWKSIVGQ